MTASAAVNQAPIPQPRLKQSSPSLETSLRRIAAFAELEADWDSYGGRPSSALARDEAARWVEVTADLFGARVGFDANPYSVAPLADGGVQIEWRGPGGIVELEVGPDRTLGYLYVPDVAADGAVEADDVSWADVLRALLRALVP